MKWTKFLIEYIKSPRTVGAIAPSSDKLAEGMIENIDFEKASCIVEYGPGTGSFTDMLVKYKKDTTKLIVIEYNKKFFKLLEDKYSHVNNIIIVNDSAENIEKYLQKHNIKEVDYIISGLPFTSLPQNISNRILENTRKVLNKNGLFITFQYTLLKKKYLGIYFEDISWKRVIYNLPPAYVLKCQNT